MSPDISLCRNEKCEKKTFCYRYIATPNPYRQSYSLFNEKNCDGYIECKSKGQLRRLNFQCEGEV